MTSSAVKLLKHVTKKKPWSSDIVFYTFPDDYYWDGDSLNVVEVVEQKVKTKRAPRPSKKEKKTTKIPAHMFIPVIREIIKQEREKEPSGFTFYVNVNIKFFDTGNEMEMIEVYSVDEDRVGCSARWNRESSMVIAEDHMFFNVDNMFDELFRLLNSYGKETLFLLHTKEDTSPMWESEALFKEECMKKTRECLNDTINVEAVMEMISEYHLTHQEFFEDVLRIQYTSDKESSEITVNTLKKIPTVISDGIIRSHKSYAVQQFRPYKFNNVGRRDLTVGKKALVYVDTNTLRLVDV